YFLRSSKQIHTSAINWTRCDLDFLEIQGNSSHGERKYQRYQFSIPSMCSVDQLASMQVLADVANGRTRSTWRR
ncbi:hypothetical protein, partial [Rhizobium leguminosarum]|uniref:hypothetical protein n=1 Tax=Rhizobium leguminosarum TaxID=384 RepID=UPI003F96CC73